MEEFVFPSHTSIISIDLIVEKMQAEGMNVEMISKNSKKQVHYNRGTFGEEEEDQDGSQSQSQTQDQKRVSKSDSKQRV